MFSFVGRKENGATPFPSQIVEVCQATCPSREGALGEKKVLAELGVAVSSEIKRRVVRLRVVFW